MEKIITSRIKLKSEYWSRRNECRRRYGVSKIRPHENTKYSTFLQSIQAKNQIANPLPKKHPLESTIMDWELNQSDLKKFMIEERPTVKLVENSDDFDKMIRHLASQHEIALDIENSYEKGYRQIAYPCLLQIGTSSTCFVVDTFAVWDYLDELRSVMQNPNITKIVHGATNDNTCYQIFWNIFMVGCVDIQIVYQELFGGQKVKIEQIMKQWLPNSKWNFDKVTQCADWRLRPLPHGMIKYAVNDVDLLLRAWQNCKEELFQCDQLIFAKVMRKNREFVLAIKPVKAYKYPFQELDDSIPNNREEFFCDLHDWRQNIAKMVDVPPNDIIPLEKLKSLSIMKEVHADIFSDNKYLKEHDIVELHRLFQSLVGRENNCSENILNSNNRSDGSEYWEIVSDEELMNQINVDKDEDSLDLQKQSNPGNANLDHIDYLEINAPLDNFEDESERELTQLLNTNTCYRCFAEGHKTVNCQFRYAKDRTPAIMAEIKARRKLHEEKFPGFHKSERARRNKNIKLSKRKRLQSRGHAERRCP